MAIRLRGSIGIVLILAGAGLYLIGQQGVAEYQTTGGQLVRTLSSSDQAQYELYTMMRLAGAGTGILGGVLVLLDVVSSGSGTSSAKSKQTGELFSGYDHDTIPSGSYTYFEFSLKKPAVLHVDVEVLNGNPINVIVTSKKNLKRFASTGDIRYHESTTGFKTTHHTTKGRLPAGDWAILIDNTNRVGGTAKQDPTKVDIEITYNVKA